MRRLLLPLLVLLLATPLSARHVVFVDNSQPPGGGDGTPDRPYPTINQALASGGDVIFVNETSTEYIESFSLRKGQILVGSAYGLDALAVDMKVELDRSAPARQGPGPAIRGSIFIGGDNIIAGCTLLPPRAAAAISTSGATGFVAIRNVFFRPSQRAYALVLQQQKGAVTISGGSMDAFEEGSGIVIAGGEGDVTIEHFPMSGSFASVLQMSGRTNVALVVRNGSRIKTDDAADDAIVLADLRGNASAKFEDAIQIRGRKRGFVALRVDKLAAGGGGSSIATASGTALELRDSGVEVSFDSVSAGGGGGAALAEGLIIDRVHGHVAVTGVNGEPGSGGAIREAQRYAVRIMQSNNVRLSNMLLAATSAQAPVKGAKCTGGFDVNTNAPCNAALYLGHVADSVFENIVIDGGAAIGVNANNIRDVKFSGLDVHRAGDEAFEAGVLVQEATRTIAFSRCSFADNAGSEVMIEQRFNSGRVTFERCTFAANERPTIATRLVDAHVSGRAQLTVEIRDSEMHDIAGSAVDVRTTGSGDLSLALERVNALRLGTGGVAAEAKDMSQIALSVRQSQLYATAASAAVDVRAADRAAVCIDLNTSGFDSRGKPIHLAAAPGAALRIVGGADPVASLAAANGGVGVALDAPLASVSSTTACAKEIRH